MRCLEVFGKLPQHDANLPRDRGPHFDVHLQGHQISGRARSMRNTMIQKLCRYRHVCVWMDVDLLDKFAATIRALFGPSLSKTI